MKQAEQRAGSRSGKHTYPKVRSIIDRQPADHSAKGHDTFDAEIENASAFAIKRTKCAKNQGRGNAQHRDP